MCESVWQKLGHTTEIEGLKAWNETQASTLISWIIQCALHCSSWQQKEKNNAARSLTVKLGQMTETRQKSDEKIREIDPSCLCLQQCICNYRKWKLCTSADICLKTFVKPHQGNAFFGGKTSLETTVCCTGSSAVAVQWRNCALDTKNSWKQVGGRQTEAVAFLGRRCSLWRTQRSHQSYCAITLKGRWLMALQQIVGSSQRLLMGMARLK